MNQSRSLASILLFILSIVLLGGLVWADYRFARSKVAGEGFSVQWISIQSLVKNGSSPYEEQVTTQISEEVPVEYSFSGIGSPKYTFPLYSGFIIFPYTLIGDKTLAQTIWMTIQFILIIVMLVLSLKLSAWKPGWYIFSFFLLFTAFSYHLIIPWLVGGLSIWAAFFLLMVFIAISTNRNELGGVFLALATIQPQMVILPLIFILIWAISNKRNVLILWFFITLILFSAIGLFLVPDWIIQYIRLLYNFSNNFPPGTPGGFFSGTWPGLGKQVGWLITGLSGLILIIEWFLALKKDFHWFLWTVCLTMVVSQWVGIPTIPGNYIELIVPVFLIAAVLTERWSWKGQWGAILLSGVIFIWEWALFYLDLTSSHPGNQLNLIFPLPAMLLIGLYWVRWWAVKPRRMLMEELRLSETD